MHDFSLSYEILYFMIEDEPNKYRCESVARKTDISQYQHGAPIPGAPHPPPVFLRTPQIYYCYLFLSPLSEIKMWQLCISRGKQILDLKEGRPAVNGRLDGWIQLSFRD